MKCIAHPTQVEINKIKGSRFLGFASPIKEHSALDSFIAERRALYPDARHWCWAYRGNSTDEYRWHDDGEPSGTAGRPILSIIDGLGLSQVAVCVVRYFGGTKLGTGGLARAYSKAARACLDAAEIQEMIAKVDLSLGFAYPLEGRLKYLIDLHHGRLTDSSYGVTVMLTAAFPKQAAEPFLRAATDLCAGRLTTSQSKAYFA